MKIDIYVRDVLWRTEEMPDGRESITYCIYRQQSAYRPKCITHNIDDVMVTIRCQIKKMVNTDNAYLSGYHTTYRADIKNDDIYIYDKNTLCRNYNIRDNNYLYNEYESNKLNEKIDSRFEILDIRK